MAIDVKSFVFGMFAGALVVMVTLIILRVV